MSEKLKVGVIGCGAIAKYAHLPGYAQFDDVEIAALADINKKRLQEMAETFGVKESGLYTDYLELLERDDIQAVSICTPNYLHAEMTIAAAEAGKHILCEKPMAMTVEEAVKMIEATEKAGVTLMMGFSHRFQNFNQLAKKLVDQGLIGDLFMIRVRFAHEGPYTSWYATSDWFFNPREAGGGALLDMGIHAIDICRWFGGEITSISAKIATLKKDIDAEDNAIALLTFPGKCLGYFEVGWTSKPGFTGIELYGSEGSMIIDYATPIKVLTTKDWPEEVEASLKRGMMGKWYYPKGVEGGGWLVEVAHFVKCLKENKKPLTTGEDGLAAVKVAKAAYDSALSGKVVEIE